MKKKLLYTFLILITLSNFVLLFMIFNKGPKNEHPPRKNFITKELKFSEDQEERFAFLDQIHRREMRQLDNDLDMLRKELFNSFHISNFSPDSISNKIGHLESLKQQELFAFFSQVRKLCSEEQALKFDKIIQKALRKRGPKPPRRGSDRRGPPPQRENF